MRTGIYLRVSTEEQATEGYSIDAQKHRLTQFAQINDWTISDYYIDEGISAKNTQRPELQRMLSDIKYKKIDVVLVYKLDRLTRSVSDLFTLLDYFDKHNCKFKSATEIFDTTSAIGRLFITIVGAMAQWERENLGERVKMGMEQKAREGKLSKKDIFGYTRINGHTFEINPDEAEIVRLIFNKYINENKGMDSIAKELNETHRHIKNWIGTSISYILKNQMYIGNLYFNKRQTGKIKTDPILIPNIYPVIIEKDVFNKAQKLIKQRNIVGASSATKPYIFSTLLRCARCGNKLTAHYSQHGIKKFNRYLCKNSKIHLCDLKSISESVLFNLVANYIKDFLKLHIDEINAIKIQTDNKIDLSVYTNKIISLEKRKSKLQTMYADDLITKDDYIKRISETKNEIIDLDKKVKEYSQDTEVKKYESTKLLEFIQNNINNIENLDATNQKIFFYNFIEEVTLDHADGKHYIANIKLRGTI
jgi:site-specific DNA recombinase